MKPMRILGIDPGTKCGWAVLEGNTVMASGVWHLAPKRHEGGGMRYVRLRVYLEDIAGLQVDAVAYEEVRRHMGVDAAHVYGGIVAVVQSWCEQGQLPYQAIPVGTIKKLATGKGNANKDAMVEAANARFGIGTTSDDEADAVFVAVALQREIG